MLYIVHTCNAIIQLNERFVLREREREKEGEGRAESKREGRIDRREGKKDTIESKEKVYTNM